MTDIFRTSDLEVVADTFRRSNYGDLDEIAKTGFIDRERPDDVARFAAGFAWPDKRFRFAPNWQGAADKKGFLWTCDPADMPRFADHFDVIENATPEHPFRLATSPARGFLNSTFNETPGSQRREGPPSVFIHPADAAANAIADGDYVTLGNRRGSLDLIARISTGMSLRRPRCRRPTPQQSPPPRPGHQHPHQLRPSPTLRRRRVS